MTDIEAQQPPTLSPLEQEIRVTFQQAVAHHQAGQLQEAGNLYRAILQIQRDHPGANHNLGVAAVQAQRPAEGLAYFEAALRSDMESERYWLDYIDALILSGQLDVARQTLALGKQHGLQGEAMEALAERMVVCQRIEDQADAAQQHNVKGAQPIPATLQDGKKQPRHAKLAKPPKKVAARHGIEPNAQEISALGLFFGQGRYIEMEAAARKLTAIYPLYGIGWKALGMSLLQQGRSAEALEYFQRAVALLSEDAEAYSNLGGILYSLGFFSEAEANLRRALELKPDYAEAHYNMGNALCGQGRFSEAEIRYRHALAIKPNSAELHYNLGITLNEQNRFSDAENCYRRALEINPDYFNAQINLGNVLKAQNKLVEAEACCRRALTIKPDHAKAHSNLGTILQGQGRFAEAQASLQHALEITPDYAEALSNLGNVYKDMGNLAGAEACYRHAMKINPEYAEAYSNLGSCLLLQGRLQEAENTLLEALKKNDNLAEVHNNLGNVVTLQGRHREAEISFRHALEIKPDYADAYSNFLFSLSHSEAIDAQALFAEHCRFGEQFEAHLRPGWPQHTNSRDSTRCLQIGFVSADLCNHAVANFIEPVLAYLASHSQLSLHAYYNHTVEDGVTQRIRGYLNHWHPIAGMSDSNLAQKIIADGIDILIDLSGHTGNNRLLTFARKPAPVQASWMGYPGTTGLRAMDYFLADRFLLPPGQLDTQFTEKIVRMPASAPFLPFKDAPPVNALPALSNGYVTFGSFNRPSKLSHAVIALWAQLLRALPDSRMLLGGMPDAVQYDTLINLFTQEGIARERLDFHPRSGMDDYLALHHHVDICLDTFPYNGGTTTCHALWMGVPTLTLAGGTAAGRPGAALLGHAGLDEFVAHDAADFMQKGLYWAENLATLSDIRAGLRERFAHSAMGQPAVVAAGVERALRIMWQRWCAGLPAESFEVSLQDIDGTTQEAVK
ncbi:MAG: tetratricopeptide repeat protein [Sulfuricellaceae bacterium]